MITTDRDNSRSPVFTQRDDASPHYSHESCHHWGIISPDSRDAMLQHAEQFSTAGIPFVFDQASLPLAALSLRTLARDWRTG
jgi:adenosine kinase